MARSWPPGWSVLDRSQGFHLVRWNVVSKAWGAGKVVKMLHIQHTQRCIQVENNMGPQILTRTRTKTHTKIPKIYRHT